LVDGRNWKVEGNENGFYVGPTVNDFVTPEMGDCKRGGIRSGAAIIRAKDLDEAIILKTILLMETLASVFTQSGGIARQVMDVQVQNDWSERWRSSSS